MMFRKSAWTEAGGFDERIGSAPDLDLLEKLTRQHDLALVDAILVRWTAPPNSHYLVSPAVRRLNDVLRVYRRMDRSRMRKEVSAAFDQKIGQEILDAAYGAVERGAYAESARLYLAAISQRSSRQKGFAGLAKLLPRRLIRGRKGPVGTGDRPEIAQTAAK
jgi:hypothetical protein